MAKNPKNMNFLITILIVSRYEEFVKKKTHQHEDYCAFGPTNTTPTPGLGAS